MTETESALSASLTPESPHWGPVEELSFAVELLGACRVAKVLTAHLAFSDLKATVQAATAKRRIERDLATLYKQPKPEQAQEDLAEAALEEQREAAAARIANGCVFEVRGPGGGWLTSKPVTLPADDEAMSPIDASRVWFVAPMQDGTAVQAWLRGGVAFRFRLLPEPPEDGEAASRAPSVASRGSDEGVFAGGHFPVDSFLTPGPTEEAAQGTLPAECAPVVGTSAECRVVPAALATDPCVVAPSDRADGKDPSVYVDELLADAGLGQQLANTAVQLRLVLHAVPDEAPAEDEDA